MISWNEYPKTKPDKDIMAYVTNTRANMTCYLASYSKDRDIFMITPYNTIPIDVTHYCELPNPPNEVKAE